MMERKHGLDSGDIWGSARSVCPFMIYRHSSDSFCVQTIPEDADFVSLRDHLAVEGGRLLVSVLKDMLTGTVRLLA